MSYQLQEINRRIDQDVKGFLEECDAQYAQKVSQAADAILTNLPHSPIVLLSGPSGSGKTTTALKIEEELEKRGVLSHTISMDNYFKTLDPKTAPRTADGLVDFESPADAYIINTCSVTAVSDKKSRQMIRRAKSRNPQAVVAACGCYVQTHTPEAQELGIDLIGGTSAWAGIALFALILSLVNISIRPIMQVLSLPVTVLTLGIFYLVVNTLMLYIAAWLANEIFQVGLVIDSFGSAFVASIVISIVSALVNALVGKD